MSAGRVEGIFVAERNGELPLPVERIAALVHRAGLNADILTDGEIAVGDPVAAI